MSCMCVVKGLVGRFDNEFWNVRCLVCSVLRFYYCVVVLGRVLVGVGVEVWKSVVYW